MDIKTFLEEKADLYNRPEFIIVDPISIPHQFTKKEDIEISGFLTATIAWGQRVTILKNANKLMEMIDYAPHKFILYHSDSDLKPFSKFIHRTFNGVDCIYFIQSLKNIYYHHRGLESVFSLPFVKPGADLGIAINYFRKIFLELDHPKRTEKHIADPLANSSAKRICMFLRWMVRKDKRRVDFGIWKNIKMSQLACPLDLHSARVARSLGLLQRKQNDWKAVMELTNKLQQLDPVDPVKYDFALFGLGINEKF
ncbi:MAG: TIGR02757 family protein [Bacteroidota bacterium]